MVEEGPLASRLGARSKTVAGDAIVYAHHPPMIYGVAALVSAIAPPEAGARLSAMLAALVALVLLVLLLRECDLPPGSASLGLLVSVATPMFMTYGAMLEPHVLGLAPMIALVLLWQRTRRGGPSPLWVWALATATTTFTSWSAGFLCVRVAILLAIGGDRQRAVAVLAATAASACLVGMWIWWAYDGSMAEPIQRALYRAGIIEGGRVTLIGMTRRQAGFLGDLFPVGSWLLVPVACFGLLDGRTRPIVAVALGAVLGYAVIFKNGASDHDYWLYCLILPLSLGASAGADAIAHWINRHVARPRVAAALVTAVLLPGLGLTIRTPSTEVLRRRTSESIGGAARAVDWPATQRFAYHVAGRRGPTDLLPWLYFYSRRQPFGVPGPESVPTGEVVLNIVEGRLIALAGEGVHD